MTRKKVTLAYITNDSERKASYKKRKKGLIKKVKELSTLCGVQACAILYSPYDREPVVWPSLGETQAVLSRFNNLSMMDRTRKMVNQDGFTRQRIKKAEDQLRRLQKENKRKELELFMYRCIAGKASLQQFNVSDAAEMSLVVNQTLRDINARMEALKQAGLHQPLTLPTSGGGTVGGQVDLTVQPPLPPPPSPSQVVAPPPPPSGEDSFPWNLSMDGSGVGGFSKLGWDGNVVLPYPYNFNNFDASNNGNPPGDGSNN